MASRLTKGRLSPLETRMRLKPERRRELTRQKVNDDEEKWVKENSNGRLLGKLDRTEKDVDYISQWPEEDDYEFL